MAQGSNTRTITLAITAIAAASVIAALVLTICYAALRLWLDMLFASLSPKANTVSAMTGLFLVITSGLFWLYTRLPQLDPDDRQRVIDSYTPATMAVLFCAFGAAIVVTLFSAKFGIQVTNGLIGRQFFGSWDMLVAGFFMNSVH